MPVNILGEYISDHRNNENNKANNRVIHTTEIKIPNRLDNDLDMGDHSILNLKENQSSKAVVNVETAKRMISEIPTSYTSLSFIHMVKFNNLAGYCIPINMKLKMISIAASKKDNSSPDELSLSVILNGVTTDYNITKPKNQRSGVKIFENPLYILGKSILNLTEPNNLQGYTAYITIWLQV